MNFTEAAVRGYPNDFCYYRDNLDTMRREAVGIHDGAVLYSVCADALLQTQRQRRLDAFGTIGDVPWGKLKKGHYGLPEGENG